MLAWHLGLDGLLLKKIEAAATEQSVVPCVLSNLASLSSVVSAASLSLNHCKICCVFQWDSQLLTFRFVVKLIPSSYWQSGSAVKQHLCHLLDSACVHTC